MWPLRFITLKRSRKTKKSNHGRFTSFNSRRISKIFR